MFLGSALTRGSNPLKTYWNLIFHFATLLRLFSRKQSVNEYFRVFVFVVYTKTKMGLRFRNYEDRRPILVFGRLRFRRSSFSKHPDSTSAFSRRNANYFACFFWIATTRINYFYLIAHNSKETREKAPMESGLKRQLSFSNSIWSLTKLNRMRLDYYKTQMTTEKCVRNSDCNNLLTSSINYK
jgi:hypothetical protein